jgi:hypothetical protein
MTLYLMREGKPVRLSVVVGPDGGEYLVEVLPGGGWAIPGGKWSWELFAAHAPREHLEAALAWLDARKREKERSNNDRDPLR